MLPFESLGTFSYLHFIVTMAVSCTVFKIKRDIGLKIARFSYPIGTRRLRWGGTPSVYCDIVWYGKSGMVWLPNGEKMDDCLTVPTQYRRVSGGQPGGQTDRHLAKFPW